MDGCSWVPYSRSLRDSQLVIAATDSDGGAVCVARGHYGGELIPGKGLVRHGKCHVSYDGKEHVLTSFEVLMNTGGFSWVASGSGQIPHNAVIGGRANDGQTLYVGRGQHLNLTIPGKVHPTHNCLYLACDWKEHSKPTYEVLVRNAPSGWIPPPTQPIPPTGPSFPGLGHSSVSWVPYSKGRPWPHNAVPAGVYKESGSHQVQYIARKRHQSSIVLGYVYVNGMFYSGWHGKELCSNDCEVLVQNTVVFPHESL